LGGPRFNQPVEGVDTGAGYGVRGYSPKNRGVHGESDRHAGVSGYSKGSFGVLGAANFGYGVLGYSMTIGVLGLGHHNSGLFGDSEWDYGVTGEGRYGGVRGRSFLATGVYGSSHNSYGVLAYSVGGDGVYGLSYMRHGVLGSSYNGYGVYGYSERNYGVYGYSASNYAAFLEGDVRITGNLEKASGSFKIDHPLDPANKYLSHSFVESPDMKNIYDGVVALDRNGEAVIQLPDWFGALNKDFRYQLTAIGAPGPNLYIAEEISDDVTNYSNTNSKSRDQNNNNRFKISGGTPGMKVSWNVTGIRKDPWANAHRIRVEEDKPDKERGYYMHPDLYGQIEENGLSRSPHVVVSYHRYVD
jgi:hypothetical protein